MMTGFLLAGVLASLAGPGPSLPGGAAFRPSVPADPTGRMCFRPPVEVLVRGADTRLAVGDEREIRIEARPRARVRAIGLSVSLPDGLDHMEGALRSEPASATDVHGPELRFKVRPRAEGRFLLPIRLDLGGPSTTQSAVHVVKLATGGYRPGSVRRPVDGSAGRSYVILEGAARP